MHTGTHVTLLFCLLHCKMPQGIALIYRKSIYSNLQSRKECASSLMEAGALMPCNPVAMTRHCPSDIADSGLQAIAGILIPPTPQTWCATVPTRLHRGYPDITEIVDTHQAHDKLLTDLGNCCAVPLASTCCTPTLATCSARARIMPRKCCS